MVLRNEDITAKISLETYVGYPDLKRISIPLAANRNGEAVGIIDKIYNLDPFVAKKFIYVEPEVINRVHSKIVRDSNNQEIAQPLLLESEIEKLRDRFMSVENLVDVVNNNVPTHTVGNRKYDDREDVLIATSDNLDPNQSNLLQKTNSGLFKWQETALQNGGWFVKPNITLKDFKGDPAYDKETLGEINPCTYLNNDGLKFNTLNEANDPNVIDNFILKLKLDNSAFNKTVFKTIKKGARINDPNILSRMPTEIGVFNELFTEKADKNEEKARIEVLKSLTGLKQKDLQTEYTINTNLDQNNRDDNIKVREFIDKVIENYEEISLDNRTKACKLVTVLNNLQDRKGWHNRITPNKSTDTAEKAHYVMTGKDNVKYNINSDLKAAAKDIKETVDLLNVCDSFDSSQSCLHPIEHIGLYGNNENNKYDQNASIESNFRTYALIDVPLTFIQKTTDAKERVKLIRQLKRSIKDTAVKYENDAKNIINFKALSRFANAIDLPLTDPSTTTIQFAPDVGDENSNLTDMSKQIEKDIESSLKTGISSYVYGSDAFINFTDAISELKTITEDEFNANTADDIIKKRVDLDVPINSNMWYPHELSTHNKDANTKHIGCANVSIKVSDNKSVRVSPSNMVLLDGRNEIIKWKDEDGNRKKIKEVYDKIKRDLQNDKELQKNKDELKKEILIKANPLNWKWACVADTDVIDDNGMIQKTIYPDMALDLEGDVSGKNFKFNKIKSRRVVDLYYRKNDANEIKMAIDQDSVANALKDIAVDASNVINLGGVTQMPNYINGNLSIFDPVDPKTEWNNVKKGGTTDKITEIAEIQELVKNIQTRYKTEERFNTIQELLSNEKNVSINANQYWHDPLSKMLVQRRKDFSKENYGLPDSLYINPLTDNMSEREELHANAILALETDLNQIFKNMDLTPTRVKSKKP